MNSHELVQALAQRLGLPGLEAHPQRGCALSFPDGLKVDLRFGAGATALCFIATLGTLAAPARSQALAGLLLSNLFFGEHGEPWFAMDRHADTVHFCRTLAFGNQTVDTVVDDLARLVDGARQFRQLLVDRQQVVA